MLIHLIAATRPNFVKIAPLYHALKKESWAEVRIIHTGQHYDAVMSDVFFEDFMLPEPDVNLGVGSGFHAEQTGKVMIAYEKLVLSGRPDFIVVTGDVNSTMAAALTGVKLQIPVAHLEAGLRSNDRSMPEEINRIVTDVVSDILWTPSADADENLKREGIPETKIRRVGNIMIDTFEILREKIGNQDICRKMSLKEGNFGVVTLHRPFNVDSAETLMKICEKIVNISKLIPLVFLIHPRTLKKLREYDLRESLCASPGIIISEPLNYVRFMNLVINSAVVITDSGGIQEETSYLGKNCITLRPNTERPVTVNSGTNRLCGIEDLEHCVSEVLLFTEAKPANIDLWDGKTAGRVVMSVKEFFNYGLHR